EERLAGRRQLAELFDPAVVKILVAHTPDRGEGRMLKIFLFDEPVPAVVHCVGTHAVKSDASAVEKERVITITLEHARDELDGFGWIALHDGVAGQRRER